MRSIKNGDTEERWREDSYERNDDRYARPASSRKVNTADSRVHQDADDRKFEKIEYLISDGVICWCVFQELRDAEFEHERSHSKDREKKKDKDRSYPLK